MFTASCKLVSSILVIALVTHTFSVDYSVRMATPSYLFFNLFSLAGQQIVTRWFSYIAILDLLAFLEFLNCQV